MRGISGCLKWGLGTLIGLIMIPGVLFVFNSVEKKDLDIEALNNAGGRFVQLDQGRVHYFLEGPEDGPLVILIHGFSVPSYVWEPTTVFLNNNGYQTLRFDLFGRGYSDRPDLIYDIALFEEQVSGLIESLGLDKPFTMVGLSMGGPIAARYAHKYPDLVNSLILISPEVTQTTNGDIFPMNIPLVGEYLMTTVMEPFVLPLLQANDFIAPDNFPEWEENYRVQLQFKGTGRALLSTIRELVRMDPELEYQVLKETSLPVLLIWGAADQTIGIEQIVVLEQILPEMDVRIIENGGHLVHFEYSEEVNLEIFEYLGKIDR